LVGAAGLTSRAQAQAARIEESDPTAAALGYKHDASKVDKARFPKYAAGQVCANCVLYQSKGNDAWAPCSAFGGKLVAAKGWCAAWAKKTG
jgi:hypothetical protein